MKIKLIFLTLLVLLFQTNLIEAQKKHPARKSKVLSSREIAEKVLPSVVLIITQDEKGNPISQGSGFVYKPGLVVTNLHVFERASYAIVKSVKTGQVSGVIEVLGIDQRNDICVIRIGSRQIPPLILGDPNTVNIGDDVYVASNPKGLEGSFTKGIVNSLRGNEGMIQIDAAVSPGSSGGVLVNQRAESVVIVRSSIASGQNLNFAISIRKLEELNLRFKHPVVLAGACGYSDRKKEGLRGPVQMLVEIGDKLTLVNGELINSPVRFKKEFDRLGNEVGFWKYDFDGTFLSKITSRFDESGLKTVATREFANGQVENIHFDLGKSFYNKLLTRNFSGSLGEADEPGGKRFFDASGNLTNWYYKDSTFSYTYDVERRMAGIVETKNDKIVLLKRYTYKTDVNGNWIQRTGYVNFSPNSTEEASTWVQYEIISREISYFQE
jgi:hypothetical protein